MDKQKGNEISQALRNLAGFCKVLKHLVIELEKNVLSFTTQDAVEVLTKSDNLNAALKNFLKREIQGGDPAGRFVKDLRTFVDKPNTSQLQAYIGRMRPKFELQLIAIGGYAHSNTIAGVVNKIIERFADDFNKTYKVSGDKIEVSDQKRFDDIVKQAFSMIDAELQELGFGGSTFLKNSVLINVFDRPVLQSIMMTFKK